MTLTLYPDQVAWLDSLSAAYRGHRRVLGVAPTGFGKTVVFAELVRRTVARGNRVVIVAHRIEIIRQISCALGRMNVPHDTIEPRRATPRGQVLVGMVQTIANRLDCIAAPKLLVVDEAHHTTAGSYRRLLTAWPDAYVLGVTASPARTDGRGLGDCFDSIVEATPMAELIRRGRLSGYQYFAPPVRADLAGIKTRAGDFAADELEAAMDASAVTGDAVRTYAQRLSGRPAIAFCVSVAHAKHVAEQFARAGWRAESVDGSTDPAVRADRIAAIGDGRLQVLTSCDIISEGTDIPAVSGAILLRPTQSLIVYLQQVGRVLRVKPDGSAAIILDHAGNVHRHGMPDAAREWTLEGRQKRAAVAQVRQCPGCYAAFAPAPRCPCCGHVFEVNQQPRDITEREGELTEVVGVVAPSRITSAEAAARARAARSLDEMRAVARAAGYKPGWAWVQWQVRQARAKTAA